MALERSPHPPKMRWNLLNFCSFLHWYPHLLLFHRLNKVLIVHQRRADTEMDKVLRRMGVFLQTAYTNKLSKDLILGEEMEKAARKSQ